MKTLRVVLAVSCFSAGVQAQTSCPDWSAGFGLPGLSGVDALATFDDGTGLALYVGGPSTVDGQDLAGHGILRWDGTTWSVPGTNISGTARAWDLRVLDDGSGPALYATGGFTLTAPPGTFPIVRWDGTSWSPVGANPIQAGSYPGGMDVRVFDDGGGPKLYLATAHSASCLLYTSPSPRDS